MTGVVRILSHREAERLTDQIKFTVESIDNGLFKLRTLLDEAQHSNVWQMLGFSSWTAYLASLFEGRPMRLAREDRQELVGYLSGEGMSVRAIAPIVGVSREQARLDVAGDKKLSPAPTAQATASVPQTPAPMPVRQVREALGDAVADAYEKVDWTPASPASKPITGLDGKQYTRPEPQAPRRPSLMDDVNALERSLFKDLEKLRAIVADDRFAKNKASIRDALRPIAGPIREILTDLFTDQS